MLCLVAENTDQGNNEPSLSLLMTCLSLPKSTEVLFIISRAGTRPIKEHYKRYRDNRIMSNLSLKSRVRSQVRPKFSKTSTIKICMSYKNMWPTKWSNNCFQRYSFLRLSKKFKPKSLPHIASFRNEILTRNTFFCFANIVN